MRRFTHLLVLSAFLFSCGGHWCLLQGVAWASMIHDYSRFVPLTEAIRMTFSGEYPCEICKAIAEKKESDQFQLCGLEKYEKKFFPPVFVAPKEPAASPLRYPLEDAFFHSRTETPPVPPPRFILA